MSLRVKSAQSYVRKYAQATYPDASTQQQTMNFSGQAPNNSRAQLSDAIKYFNESIKQLRQSLNPQIQGVNSVVKIRDQINALMQQTQIDDSIAEPLKIAFVHANKIFERLIAKNNGEDNDEMQQTIAALRQALDDFQSKNPSAAQAAQAVEPQSQSLPDSGMPQANMANLPPPPKQWNQSTFTQWVNSIVPAANSITDPQALSGMVLQLSNLAGDLESRNNHTWAQSINAVRDTVQKRMSSLLQDTATNVDPSSGQMAWQWGGSGNSPGAPPGAGTVNNPNPATKPGLGQRVKNFFRSPARASQRPALTALAGSALNYKTGIFGSKK